jgi:streptogramin lyase
LKKTYTVPNDFHIQTICSDGKENVWLFTQDGLVLHTNNLTNVSQKNEANHFFSKNIVFYKVALDEENRIWVTSDMGLYVIQIDEYGLLKIQTALDRKLFIDILFDQSKNVWVGSNASGVYRYSPHKNKFKQFNLKDVSTSVLSVVNENSHSLWIGTDREALINWNINSGTYTIYDQFNTLKDNAILSVLTSTNSLWLGCSHGLYLFNKLKKNLLKIPFEDKNVPEQFQFIKTICITNDGMLWAGGVNALYYLDPTKNSLIKYSYINNLADIRYLTASKNNTLYIATENGCFELNQKTNLYTHKFDILPKYHYTYIYEDTVSDTYWLGTHDHGVLKYEERYKKITQLNETNGLTNNCVYRIEPDGKGNMWCSTNNGINKIAKTSLSITQYDIRSGLPGNEFNGGASHRLADGTLLFGGVDGLIYFHPSNITINPYAPMVVLEDIYLHDDQKPIDNKQYYYSYSQNTFTFHFAALEYTSPEKNKFKYMLEGVDIGWITSDNNSVRYAGLAPGKYTFIVKACNNDGVWSNQAASYVFEISPPFWKTIWFYILTILIVTSISTYFFYRRIQFITKREEEKTRMAKELAALELKALRAQMNPHFIFNALNSIQDFILSNQPKDAAKYLTKFARLIRMILDNSEQKTISLERKIDFLKLYIEIESLRFSEKFQYQVLIAPEINTTAIEVPTMLIQPYVENAIWHGLLHQNGERILTLAFKPHDAKTIICEVTDNGVGRQKSNDYKSKHHTNHVSKGLKITESRFKLLGEQYGFEPTVSIIDLFDDKKNPAGTKVIIQIPFIEK